MAETKSLKEVYAPYFKIGAAISYYGYQHVSDIICKHFSTVTCENEMKYASVCNENGQYDLSKADQMYAFAMKNGIEMRGHTLMWHNQNHAPVFAGMTKEQILERVTEHMNLMNRHFPDLSCWDVINEVVSDSPDEFLRDTVFKQKFGDDYVRFFYGLARQTMPGKRLVLNDYNEFIPHKRAHILQLAKSMKEEGVIDALGLQAHIRPKLITIDDLKRTFDDYATAGLPLQITELDIGLPDMDDPTPVDQISREEHEKHAEFYGRYFALLREYSELIESVTLWGVSDDMTWLNYFRCRRPCTALLFGRDHQPTPAFEKVIDF